MKLAIAVASAITMLALASASGAQAHARHHARHSQAWCQRHDCATLHAKRPSPRDYAVRRHYPVLDGTEPLCGFNDGTYLRNWLECGM